MQSRKNLRLRARAGHAVLAAGLSLVAHTGQAADMPLPQSPADAARAQFEALLANGIPDAPKGDGTVTDESMTRAQFAKLAAQLFGVTGATVKVGSGNPDPSPNPNPNQGPDQVPGMPVMVMEFLPEGPISSPSVAQMLTLLTGQIVKESERLKEALTAFGPETNPNIEALQKLLAMQLAGEVLQAEIIGETPSVVPVLVPVPVPVSPVVQVPVVPLVPLEFPYSSAGTVTPRANWPTALNATYNGKISGSFAGNVPVTGSIAMSVNFANISSAVPNIPGNIVFDGGKGGASFVLVQMGGYVGNPMTSGSYNGQAMTEGYIREGQFFGPAANEVAGKWDMKTATTTGGGTFAGKR